MIQITKNLEKLRSRIARAAAANGRNENDVSLLPVSKRHPVESIESAYAAGLSCMAENYLQEALEKIPACNPDIQWHYIGRIQSNKTRAIAASFQWVHTVSSLKIARRLSDQRPAESGPLNICLQIDIDGTGEHGGASPADASALCAEISALPNLTLRGLMCIPLPTNSPEDQRAPFRQLRELYGQLNTTGYQLDTLSMGMSGDLEAAIAEGSTMVRIGTALFGPRPS
ncbi:MAG: YggS family pyridoxal phosphate-dependent enzyme [Gammaproteobacteria bacterium]